ncbi:hypothetical protein [Paenibacillus sanfengchensis]|uniref:hypothetical protein n=1 Tax=Paenibacillus sanfengchensis TaxID=3119819 RepID=UPI002FE0A6C0
MYLAAHDDKVSLRNSLEKAKINIRLIDEYGEDPGLVTSNSNAAIKEINVALGEGDRK